MTDATRYREIEVSGPPRELGRQLGEAARDEIRGFCDIALERVNLTAQVSAERARRVAADSVRFVEGYGPHMLEELRGTAEGAGVTLDAIMLLQVRNQLTAEADAGCTSFATPARPSLGLGPIVAQNWDNDPELDPFTIVLTRRPEGHPAFMTVGAAGVIAYIGFSEAGMGLCLNTLPAASRPLGVPHYFTVRGIYESRTLDGAIASVERARRALPANIMLSTPQGPADLEVTIDDIHVLRPADADGLVTHTNHCVHPDLGSVRERFGDLAQSGARKLRIDELLDRSTTGMSELQAALRDHAGQPRSICRHANADPDTGIWQTVFSVIIEPRERRMHISRGTPCEAPYETYRLD